MATELIKRTWCDLHLADGENVQATTYWRFGIDAPNGGHWKWITLDVCQDHADQQLAPMAELLVKVGQSFEAPAQPPKRSGLQHPLQPTKPPRATNPSRNPNAPKPYQCDQCDKSFTKRTGLSMHQRRTEGHTWTPVGAG